MADILIRGMDKPHNCFQCDLSHLRGERLFCHVTKDEVLRSKIASDCPIQELPEHGDLVDRDEYIAMMESNCDKSTMLDSYIFHVCRGGVKTMPVIVPSNKEESE